MTPERWEEIERLYHRSLARALGERDAFLRSECAGDNALRHEVESLLAKASKAAAFMDTPALEVAARALAVDSRPSLVGRTFGPYTLLSRLGAGGMGEVYRATDTKLGRDVALKFLPETFTDDPERLARFRREAQVLAALNHPHIGAIYGLDEANGLQFLVLELVDGESLDRRIVRGPIPIVEALEIAKQIAEALEAAHEKGIIHRDLKPPNIALTSDGNVKVLDFGLAKSTEVSPGSTDLRNSPTITSLAMATGVGVILGTAAYMSPEQAAGKALDKRSDLWAFGVVVLEMLTGRSVFVGETVSHVLASVLTSDPDWTTLPTSTPVAIRRLLRRCLEKDRKRRLDSAADARLEIEDALAPSGEATTVSATIPSAQWLRALPWGIAGTAVAGLMLLVVLWAPPHSASPPRVTRMTITASGSAALTINGFDRDMALSPDGKQVVYVGNGGTQLFVRSLEALEPVPIASGAGVRAPFVSPNGQWVGFIESGNTIRKVAITGGPPITLARLDGASRGATWAPDDTIIFATSNPATGLQRVSAAGGTPEVLTRPDHVQGEADHVWPEVLPGGRAVLFTITAQAGGLDAAKVAVRDLHTGMQKIVVVDGSHARYVATGHLVYIAAGTLRAIPFDLTRRETSGTAVPVLSRLVTTGTGTGDFAVASDGTLLYVDAPGSLAANAHIVVWVDRSGKEEPLAASPRAYEHPRLSPDGTRVALASIDQEEDVWIWDFGRATLTRFTFDPGRDWFPVWTPDGRRLVFTSNRGGQANLWWQAADGTGVAERLTTSVNNQRSTGTTPDGTSLVFDEAVPSMGRDLLQLALNTTRHVTPLLQTKFDERNGIVSPDGRWLAYESNSSGPFAIYVRPFPNVGSGQWQVSTAGGTQPLWARSGKELFYVGADGTLQGVPVEASDATWHAGTPTKLLEAHYYTGVGNGRTYDVSSDGRRFLMIKAPGTEANAAPPELIVVQHWDEELKRLAPIR